MTRSTRLATFWLLLFAGFTSLASAQGVQTGTVRGSVEDQQTLPIPGALVTLTSPALQGQRTTTTDGSGLYSFTALPPGDYTIVITRANFATETRQHAVPLGGAIQVDVTLRPARVTEEVRVTPGTQPLIATADVGLHLDKSQVDALPIGRTLDAIASLSPSITTNAPNSGQLVINGAFAYDNSFLVNGVDVNDNIFGDAHDLFIEDAIEETQTLTSGISAEYGRFSGGVINAITKSGGNEFAGSYRINLTDSAWRAETPFERDLDISHESKVNAVHEGTFGGPISRDRLWFFAAGRAANLSTSETLDQTGLAYKTEDKNRRGEIKLTGTIAPGHTLQGGYLNNHRELIDSPSFDFSLDRHTFFSETIPNWYAFTNYRGILNNRFLAEAQYSERRFAYEGFGGTDTNIINSPFLTNTQENGHYNAPYFDATDPEERNNRQFTGSLTTTVQSAGRHDVKTGYEFFRSQEVGGNSQSATNFVFFADYATNASGSPVFDGNGYLIPQFIPLSIGGFGAASALVNWRADRGSALNVDTQSIYMQDHWTISPNVTADLGFRFEHVRSETTGNIVGVDTDTIVPRLALAYDPKGDGARVFHVTYAHYAGRYNEAQIAANSNVGEPDVLVGLYNGPAGEGRGFAPGFDPNNYITVFGRFPKDNVFFEDGLSSPLTREFTLSAAGTMGARASGAATYVWRRTSDVIEDFIELQNGSTEVESDGEFFGPFTNSIYRNTDMGFRAYQSLVFQGRYRITNNWSVDGNWTVQLKNEGNFVGEGTNQPAISSVIGDYPEAFNEMRHYPVGRLPSFQRHQVRAWTTYDYDLGRWGDVAVSGLVRGQSGLTYSLAAGGLPTTAQQDALLAAYPDLPSDQTIYFGGRGTGDFAGYCVLDTSINYRLPVGGRAEPWLKFDVTNLLNNDKLIGWNTTVNPDFSGPVDALGLPTNYIEGSRFGQGTSNAHYPVGRTIRVYGGFRF